MKGAALRSVLPYESIKELLMLTVFFTTAADPSLVLQMMPYRIPSFRAEVRMLYEKTGRRLNHNMTQSEESIILMTPYRLIQGSWSRPSEEAAGARSAIEDTRLS